MSQQSKIPSAWESGANAHLPNTVDARGVAEMGDAERETVAQGLKTSLRALSIALNFEPAHYAQLDGEPDC